MTTPPQDTSPDSGAPSESQPPHGQADAKAPLVGHRSSQPDAIAPDGSEIRLLLDHRHQASRASMVEVALDAGQVSRPVWHRQVEEVWYVLEGQGQVWRCPPEVAPAAMPPVPVGPGDALVIPAGWTFQFSAAHNSRLRFLCVTIPPWPGDHEAVPAPQGGLAPPTL